MHGKPSLISNASSHPAAPVPLWRLGFRPFFLFGSAFAVVALLLWSLALSGHGGNCNPLGDVLARLLVPIIGSTGLMLAASGWTLAFTLFITCYRRILLSARADGQPG